MLYLVAAMHCEAKPLIREFGLKRDNSARFFEIYKSDDKMLVVSGIGKMRSAIATSHVLSRVEPKENAAVINIGTCGSISKKLSIGTPILINKIRDEETEREYYPDMLLSNIDIDQGRLETYNKIVRSKDVIGQWNGENEGCPEYVDMEASGFFQAAERFVGPHQIYVIKIISDFLEGDLPDKAYITDCMESALPKVKSIINEISNFCGRETQKEVITLEDRKILDNLIQHLRLTNYQSHQLYDIARAFKIRTGSGVPEFREIMGTIANTKEEGKMLFEHVCNILTAVKE